MAKSYSNDIKDEIYRDHSFTTDLIEIHLKTSAGANNTLYLNSGNIDVDYDSTTAPDAGSNTYSAQGEFLGMSQITEDFDVIVGKFSIFLSGLPSNYIDYFTDAPAEGQRVCVYKAFHNLETFAIIDTPILMFDGTVYNVGIVEGQVGCQINIECSSLFADFERVAGRRTNNASNHAFQGQTTDTAFAKSGLVGQTEFLWGRTK